MTQETQYLELLNQIINTGTRQQNRTGVSTIFIPGAMMKFDLRTEFPAFTTKKLAFKAVVGELIGFLRGYDNAAEFRSLGCNIWNQNANENQDWLNNPFRKGTDDLGRIYGNMWRRWNVENWEDSVVEVEKRKHGINKPFALPQIPKQEVVISDDMTGQRLQDNNGDIFTVIKKISLTGEPNSKYLIQYTDTSSLVEVLRPNLKRGQAKDPFRKTIFGEGCLGIIKEKPKYYTKAYNLWYNMMRRCYDTTLPEYQLYGGRGIFVDQNWRCFSNFLHDITQLPLFDRWNEYPSAFDLDKDYYCADSYSKKTCVFLPKKYNVALPHLDGNKYIATHKKTGVRYEFTIQQWGAKKLNLKHSQQISTALHNSPTKSTKEWAFKIVKPRDGFVFRQQIVEDQVNSVLQKLYNNPTDRRMIINAWRPDEFQKMALPPCHVLYQFIANVERKELHLCMYQRSCDEFLGVPFNVASASLFLTIMANLSGYTPATFTHFMADAHIYENHLDAVNEQLNRTPHPLPQLKYTGPRFDGINKFDATVFDTIQPEHFELLNYQHHPAIKAPMAV